jgi:hypothetical protein
MPNRGAGLGKEDETAVSPSKHYVPTENFSIAKEVSTLMSSDVVVHALFIIKNTLKIREQIHWNAREKVNVIGLEIGSI